MLNDEVFWNMFKKMGSLDAYLGYRYYRENLNVKQDGSNEYIQG